MVRKKTHWFFTSLMIGAAFFVCAPMLLSALALIVPSQAYAATSATAVNVIDPASGNIVSTGATPPAGLSGSGSLMSCTFEFTSATESDTFLSNTLGTSDLDLTDGTWADALNGSSAPNGTYFANLNSAEASYIASNYNKSIPIVQLEDAGGTQPVNGSSQSSSDCSTIVLMPLSASLWEGVDFCGFQQGDGTAFTVGAGQSCLNSSNISVSQAQGLTLTPVTMSFTLTGTSGGQSNGTLSYYDNGKNNTVTQESATIVAANTTSTAPSSSTTGTGPIGTGSSPGSTTTTSDTGTTPSCENDGGDLAWIMCEVLDGLANTVGGIYNDVIVPMLKVPALDASTGGSTGAKELKNAWSDFRIYGNIFLIIALLVVVFGEAIGGGLIDAYTAKKVLPRILTSAVLINLSFYIVAAAVDIFNVIGVGLGDLISNGFGMGSVGSAHFEIAPNGSTQAGVVTILGGGTILVGITSIIPHIFSVKDALTGGGVSGGITAAASLFEGLLFAVLLPALMVFLAIMATLIIRLGLIYLLVVLSPVAFACYVLPNTERYFKKWWEVLRETLMVFPIISAMFALSIVLSQSTVWATQSKGFVAGGLGYIISLLMLVIPLALIPFAFKMAGDVIGRLHEVIDGTRQSLHERPGMKSRRERAKQKASDVLTQGKDKTYDRWNKGGKTSRWMARRAGGYNIKGRMAEINARVMKEMQAQNDTGDDTERRALTVNKKWALTKGEKGVDWRIDPDDASGKRRQFRTLGGKWVDEGAVDSAYALHGYSMAAKQWSLGHEMEKANTQEEQDYLASHWKVVAGEGGSWNLDTTQRGSVWQGAAFAKQNINRQWKHYGMDQEGGLKMAVGNALNLFREIDEKQGSYAMMQQNADTWTTMSEAMRNAANLINNGGGTETQRTQAKEILERGARIAAATRSSSMADTVVPGDGDHDTTPAAVLRGGAGRQVGAGAPGRVQEEIIRFVNTSDTTAGVYNAPRGNPDFEGKTPVARPVQLPPEQLYDNLDRRQIDRINPPSPTDRPDPDKPNDPTYGGQGPRRQGF